MFARTCGFDSRLAHQKNQTEKSGFFVSRPQKFFKNRYCIFERSVILYQSCLTAEYPGVAKFGIALEWGSRGLEFESQHSDQNLYLERDAGFFYLLKERGTQGLLLREAQA